ncbi:phosphatase PAP2 family protein [Mycobacterium sp. MYCO198283]|uniref:phosphatase PAP2 family protein n=1 Tax=Mycobacterium sp. MYCO198283 TaxID=2883505 RepID=UPI001E4AEBEC|nr:phosphatase PAP2 family protein [Mycobacterium sp. MYCO198283]MCG5432092.1 phosphatase PAP2 family protein [Mycobacterium sp. MYCO198283]
MRRWWTVAHAVLAVAVVAAMWAGYALQWPLVVAVDDNGVGAAAAFGADRPGWIRFWGLCCDVFSPTGFRLAAVVVAVAAWRQHNRRAAVFLVAAAGLGGLAVEVLKAVANRPRPAEAFVDAHATSFPSGHAAGAVVGVVALLVVLRPRRWWWAPGVAVILAVGIGRVLLCVHHPSDVLAGWAVGYLCVLLCLAVIRPQPLSRPASGENAAGTPAAPGSAP